MKKKHFLAGVALAAMLALVSTLMMPGLVRTSMAAQNYIQVKVNGAELQGEVQPVIVNGCTMVPMRAIFEALGAELIWDPDMGMVGAQKGDVQLKLKINSKDAWIGMKSIKLEIAPIILDSHTMVPVRFIAQSLGEKVEWDGVNRIVYIGSKTPLPVKTEDTNYVKEYTLNTPTSLAYAPGKTTLLKGLIKMRSKDYIESGILAEDCFLPYNKRGLLVKFKGNTPISFHKEGFVASGTIVFDSPMEYAPSDMIDVNLISSKDRNCVDLKAGTLVEIDSSGYVTSGVLACDKELIYGLNRIAVFKDDYPIKFQKESRVLSGTLKDSIYQSYVDNNQMLFVEGSFIEFWEDGRVKSGVIGENTKLQIDEQLQVEVEFKKDNPLSFNEKGYVTSGTLNKDTALPYREGIHVQFKSDTEVCFYDNGLVSRGTLASTTTLRTADGTNKSFAGGTNVSFDTNGNSINISSQNR